LTAIAEDASRERCPAMALWVDHTQKLKKEVARMKEKNLERLYKLLERADRENYTETAAALRWAIFELENR
jgi:hypothetical protein